MMASALGAIYRQTSASHHAQECPCGWIPLASDVKTLQADIETGARRQPVPDLSSMQLVGRARRARLSATGFGSTNGPA